MAPEGDRGGSRVTGGNVGGSFDWNSDVENQSKRNRKKRRYGFLEAQIRRANGL